MSSVVVACRLLVAVFLLLVFNAILLSFEGISTQFSSLGLIDLNSDSKDTQIQTEISFFASNDKCVQTDDRDDNIDDTDGGRRRDDLSDEKFSEFEPKVRQKSPKSGQKCDKKDTIYTYFASLSPLSKRSVVQSSHSSSLSSVCRPSVVSQSPDLGIETEVNQLSDGNGNCVRLSLKDFRKLRKCLNECLIAIKEQNLGTIQELINNCLNICQKFYRKSESEENLLKKFEKMRKSKQNMEKAIQKQLNKTNELLNKTKENL